MVSSSEIRSSPRKRGPIIIRLWLWVPALAALGRDDSSPFGTRVVRRRLFVDRAIFSAVCSARAISKTWPFRPSAGRARRRRQQRDGVIPPSVPPSSPPAPISRYRRADFYRTRRESPPAGLRPACPMLPPRRDG